MNEHQADTNAASWNEDERQEATTSGAVLSPAELWDQAVETARQELDRLAATVTQREWLQITTRLERTRAQIGADSGLTMLALAWAKHKHEHGGASWDRLLDMTDRELEAIHGFPAGDRPDGDAGEGDQAS